MGKQKSRTLAAKQAQTSQAREAKARNQPGRGILDFVANEYRRGMAEGRWKTRAEACRDLQKQADTIAHCLRMSHFSPLRLPKKCSDPDRGYSRRLYLFIGAIERDLSAIDIHYPTKNRMCTDASR